MIFFGILLLFSCSNLKFSNKNKFSLQRTIEFLNMELIKAAKEGNKEYLEFLLTQETDINSTDDIEETPLIKAIFANQIECALLLIEKGADVNKLYPGGHLAGEYDEFALNVAVYQNNNLIVKALLKAGANPNQIDGYDKTPILHAIDKDNMEIFNMLLEAGAIYNYWQEDY